MSYIDINCDVGEGVGNEAQLMPLISSCNIACGGHAGSVEIIKQVLAFAKAENVKIGAHPSYPDPENFGRQIMNISPSDLKKSLTSQILLVKRLAEENSQGLHHVKPHGALYNVAAVDESLAQLITEVVLEIDPELKLYVPYISVLENIVQKELSIMLEGFADRRYTNTYTLVNRSIEGAVITDENEVVKQVLSIVAKQRLTTISGKEIPFKANTICVHGDTKNAVEILQALHQALTEARIQIK